MHRRFCARCGVHLFSEAEVRPHLIFVRAGTLDDPNIGKGYWGGKRQFGIAQELQFPFGIGIIKDGKNLGVERQAVKPE